MKKHFNLSHLISSHDLLGHKIQLNFNKKGSTHKTLIGGILSILIKILMVIYTLTYLDILVNYR